MWSKEFKKYLNIQSDNCKMLLFHPQNGTDQEECCQFDYLMHCKITGNVYQVGRSLIDK